MAIVILTQRSKSIQLFFQHFSQDFKVNNFEISSYRLLKKLIAHDCLWWVLSFSNIPGGTQEVRSEEIRRVMNKTFWGG
jgi:hypothetical protein